MSSTLQVTPKGEIEAGVQADGMNFSRIWHRFGTRQSAPVDLENPALFRPKQVHGNRVIIVDESNADPARIRTIPADALITSLEDCPLGIVTADCVPVLLVDPVRRVIAAAHAGWRGIVAGLVERVVDRFVEHYGSSTEDLFVALGPALSADHFEVGSEVVAAFEDCPDAVILKEEWPRPHIDLYRALQLKLERVGIGHMIAARYCTYDNVESFHSFRRDGSQAGRQVSLIGLGAAPDSASHRTVGKVNATG